MKRTKPPVFNVIVNNFNLRKNEPYDVIPYFVNCYKKLKKDKRPSSIKELKEFIENESMYMFWSRCEWEIIISDWPPSGRCEEKWDVHQQIMMNFDVITNLLAEYFEIK